MSLTATALRTNARNKPLGIDTLKPQFSWQLDTSEVDVLQRAYTLQVATSPAIEDALIWDSSAIQSDLPFSASYDGPPLASMTRYWWRVRVSYTSRDAPDSALGAWSEPSWFETALLDSRLWTASWIGGAPPSSKASDPVLYLRRTITLPAAVANARAYVSALGWYRLFVNGHDLTGDALVPRWTPLSEVIEYQTYDLSDALHVGDNIIAIAVADGRYRGGLGLGGTRQVYGDRIGALGQFEIRLTDGSIRTAVTDTDWVAGPGRITGADPKNGERVDLRITDQDWLTGPAAPSRFTPAVTLPAQEEELIAEEVERVRRVDVLHAACSRAPSGAQLLDFGQNFAGVCRIRLSGPAGSVVHITHGELLTPGGELDTQSFVTGRQFYQRDTITLDGNDSWYQPWFTIHGFRYAEVRGLDHDISPDEVEGIVLSSDLARTGTFRASDTRLEQLHHNVLWSVISNFTDTPTDCPTRERSGWTGDIQAFAPTAAVLVDSQAFLARYLRNAAIEAWDDGSIPIYIPSQMKIKNTIGRRMTHFMSGSVGWSDAAVLVPWIVYQYYGDRQLLERQYDSMRRRVDGMAAKAARTRGGRYLLNSGFHFGEWLRPGEAAVKTILTNIVRPPAEIATAYFAHTADVLAQAARAIGRDSDAERYRTLHQHIVRTWQQHYAHPDGTLAKDRQDDYVRALAFHLIPDEQRPAAVERLVTLIHDAGTHLNTGFLSTPLLLQVLVDNQRADVALALLFQTTNPSWLHQIARGATTVWETWEGYNPDGSGKESHNHYALGSVAGWLTQGLAGLIPAAPGWRQIAIDPLLAPQLDFVESVVDTPFGPTRSAWHRVDEQVVLDITVPPGTTATVADSWAPEQHGPIGSGTHRFLCATAAQR